MVFRPWVVISLAGTFAIGSGVITCYLGPDLVWFQLSGIKGDIITWFAVPQFVKCSLGVIRPVGGCLALLGM